MMTQNQHLLLKLAEELAEAAQRALKAAQFGPEEVQPGQPHTNTERLEQELNDVCALCRMCEEAGLLRGRWWPSLSVVQSKKEKVAKYRRLSVQLGQVEPAPPVPAATAKDSRVDALACTLYATSRAPYGREWWELSEEDRDVWRRLAKAADKDRELRADPPPPGGRLDVTHDGRPVEVNPDGSYRLVQARKEGE